jgi:hypothetical protein
LKLENGTFRIDDYHDILLSVFHQVRSGSASLALAAARIGVSQLQLRDYLLKHAEEEKEHWKWLASDLASTGFFRNSIFPR